MKHHVYAYIGLYGQSNNLIFTAGQHSLLCMQSAVLAMIDSVWPSDRLSVTRWYHAKTTPATIMRSSLRDSPMTLVSWRLTSSQNSKGGSEGDEWERGTKNVAKIVHFYWKMVAIPVLIGHVCVQQSYRCGVQWSARSVSEPRKTCVADALSLCGSWASC